MLSLGAPLIVIVGRPEADRFDDAKGGLEGDEVGMMVGFSVPPHPGIQSGTQAGGGSKSLSFLHHHSWSVGSMPMGRSTQRA